MKKNKTIAFIIAGALMIGGTFMGTKAWFTDSKETANNIVITMGTFELQLKENPNTAGVEQKGWILKSKTSSGDVSTSEGAVTTLGAATNIRPGDYFEKSIEIKNTGTLAQKLTVTSSLAGNELCDVTVTGAKTGDTLAAGNTTILNIVITPKADLLVSPTHEGAKILDFTGNLKIDAKQVNDTK